MYVLFNKILVYSSLIHYNEDINLIIWCYDKLTL